MSWAWVIKQIKNPVTWKCLELPVKTKKNDELVFLDPLKLKT